MIVSPCRLWYYKKMKRIDWKNGHAVYMHYQLITLDEDNYPLNSKNPIFVVLRARMGFLLLDSVLGRWKQTFNDRSTYPHL